MGRKVVRILEDMNMKGDNIMPSDSDKKYKILSVIPEISLLKRKQPDLDKEIYLELRRDPDWQKRELAYQVIQYQIDQDRKGKLYRKIMSAILCVAGIGLFVKNFPEIGLFMLGAGLYEYVPKYEQKSLLDEYQQILNILKENGTEENHNAKKEDDQ